MVYMKYTISECIEISLAKNTIEAAEHYANFLIEQTNYFGVTTKVDKSLECSN